MSRTYSQLVDLLNSRGNAIKAAATKSAAGDTPTEKDPAEKGVTAIPKDPNATPAAQNLPANSTNVDVTPVVSVTPAKTVGTDTKTASIVEKAANVLASIKNLRKSATASEITPTMVCDKGSDNKDTAPAPSTSNAPAPKQNPDPTTKDAAGDTTTDVKDPNAKKVEMPKVDSKGEIPASAKNKDESMVSASCAGGDCDPKMAADGSIEFDPSFHYKLASMILSTEEGRTFARSVIEAAHGAAEAEDIIKAASFMEDQAWQYQQLEEQGAFEAEKMWEAASPEERQSIIKLATAHSLAKSILQTDEEKCAYDAGAAAGAQALDSGALNDPAPGAAGAADGSAPAPAGGDDTITDDDIVAVLGELVQSGQIKPEEAEAILQALQSGGAENNPTAPAGADPSAAPAPSGSDAGSPPADASDDQKAAYAIVKSASIAADLILADLNKSATPAATK